MPEPAPRLDARALAGRAVRGSMWAATGAYSTFVVNFIAVAALARYVSPSGFGSFSLALAYNQILYAVGLFPFGQSVVQSPDVPGIAETAMRMSLALRGGLLLLSLPVAIIVNHFNGFHGGAAVRGPGGERVPRRRARLDGRRPGARPAVPSPCQHDDGRRRVRQRRRPDHRDARAGGACAAAPRGPGRGGRGRRVLHDGPSVGASRGPFLRPHHRPEGLDVREEPVLDPRPGTGAGARRSRRPGERARARSAGVLPSGEVPGHAPPGRAGTGQHASGDLDLQQGARRPRPARPRLRHGPVRGREDRTAGRDRAHPLPRGDPESDVWRTLGPGGPGASRPGHLRHAQPGPRELPLVCHRHGAMAPPALVRPGAGSPSGGSACPPGTSLRHRRRRLGYLPCPHRWARSFSAWP